MFFIIGLVITIVLWSKFKMAGGIFMGILASLLAYTITEMEFVAFVVYIICAIPWGKFDEKRRKPKASCNEITRTNTYERSCPSPANVYYIETLNINNSVSDCNRDIVPTYNNKYEKMYDEYRTSLDSEIGSSDNGWKITGVDWDALEKDLRAQGR